MERVAINFFMALSDRNVDAKLLFPLLLRQNTLCMFNRIQHITDSKQPAEMMISQYPFLPVLPR